MNPTSETPTTTPAPPPAAEPVLDPVASATLPALVPAAEPPPETSVAVHPESSSIVMSSALGAVETLSETDQMEFYSCEVVLEMDGHSFVEVGRALALIRDKRFYRGGEYKSFEDYCRQKWHYGRRYVNRVINASQLFTRLGPVRPHNKPEHEWQIRPLMNLTLENAQLAWEHAADKAGTGKITARLVQNAVKELQQGANATPVAQEPRVNKAEQRRLIGNSIGELLVLLSQKASHGILTEKVELLHSYIQPLLAKPASRKS